MRAQLKIRCSCGKRIFRKNIIQVSFYYRLLGSSFIVVKYKCPRCKRVGEYIIEEKKWNVLILQEETKGELTHEEVKKFEKMGKITVDELVEFHNALQREGLKALIK